MLEVSVAMKVNDDGIWDEEGSESKCENIFKNRRISEESSSYIHFRSFQILFSRTSTLASKSS